MMRVAVAAVFVFFALIPLHSGTADVLVSQQGEFVLVRVPGEPPVDSAATHDGNRIEILSDYWVAAGTSPEDVRIRYDVPEDRQFDNLAFYRLTAEGWVEFSRLVPTAREHKVLLDQPSLLVVGIAPSTNAANQNPAPAPVTNLTRTDVRQVNP